MLNLFALVRSTEDGMEMPTLRPKSTHYDFRRGQFEEHIGGAETRVGDDWRDRSMLLATAHVNIRLQATFLALRDWRRGEPLFEPPKLDPAWSNDIENRYGLNPYGSSLSGRARDYAPLLHVLCVIAGMMTRSDSSDRTIVPSLNKDVVCVPHDLEQFTDEVLFGMPFEACDISRVGVDGFSRAWTLSVYNTVQNLQFEQDLPVIERVRLVSEEPDFRKALPTPGLAERIRKELAEKPRSPVTEPLMDNTELLNRFYHHPLVIRAHVHQGQGRYRALRILSRRA